MPEDTRAQAPSPPATSEYAIASLVLGICAFVNLLGVEKGILAIVFAILALRKISNAQGTLGGKGLAIAAIVLGALLIVIVAVVFPTILAILAKIAEEFGKTHLP